MPVRDADKIARTYGWGAFTKSGPELAGFCFYLFSDMTPHALSPAGIEPVPVS
jgi:hypothetical protein